MKRKIVFILVFVLSFIFLFNLNINAKNIEDNDTPKMEQYERDYTDEVMPKMKAATVGGLTIPTEGVYDTIKDTKNSAGVLTERRYYYKSKLVEKRTYTSTASSDCRMRNKYLYFSDGSTIERHRTYSNTGDTCYNLQTKVYTDKSKLKSHTFYEGKVDGYITEVRTYDESGVYYIGKSFYKKGIVDKKEYWNGVKPNKITHIANFNSAGTNWTDATYYDDDGDKTSYVKYAGTEPNKKLYTLKYDKNTQEKITSIYYDETGVYIDFITTWKDGLKKERTYYNKDNEGKKNRTVYYDDKDDSIVLNIKYYNDAGNYIKDVFYDDFNQKIIEKEVFYKENNIKDYVVYNDLSTDNLMIEKHIFSENEESYVHSYYYDENDLDSEEIYYEDQNYEVDEEGSVVGETKKITHYNINEDGGYEISLIQNFKRNNLHDNEIHYDDELGYKYLEVIYSEDNASYEEIYYDEDGNVISNKEINIEDEKGEMIIDVSNMNEQEILEQLQKNDGIKTSVEGNIYKEAVTDVSIQEIKIDNNNSPIYNLSIEREILLPLNNNSITPFGLVKWDKTGGIKAYTNLTYTYKTIYDKNTVRVLGQNGYWEKYDGTLTLKNKSYTNVMSGMSYSWDKKKNKYIGPNYRYQTTTNKVSKKKMKFNYTTKKYKYYAVTPGAYGFLVAGKSKATVERGKSSWTFEVNEILYGA